MAKAKRAKRANKKRAETDWMDFNQAVGFCRFPTCHETVPARTVKKSGKEYTFRPPYCSRCTRLIQKAVADWTHRKMSTQDLMKVPPTRSMMLHPKTIIAFVDNLVASEMRLPEPVSVIEKALDSIRPRLYTLFMKAVHEELAKRPAGKPDAPEPTAEKGPATATITPAETNGNVEDIKEPAISDETLDEGADGNVKEDEPSEE